MAFVNQTGDGKFVAWGKEKGENSFVVKKGKSITGKVLKIKSSDKYGKILELKTKEESEPLIIVGTTILVRELGYTKIDSKKNTYENNIKEREDASFTVNENDVIRITFNGMLKTKTGNDAYDLTIEKDM